MNDPNELSSPHVSTGARGRGRWPKPGRFRDGLGRILRVAANAGPLVLAIFLAGVTRVSAATPTPAKLYTTSCMACHGADGRGLAMKATMPTIPDFTSKEWQDEVSNPKLTVSILEGKGTLMPGYRDRLTDEQTKELVAYIRAFAQAKHKPKEKADSSSDFDKELRDLQHDLADIKKKKEKPRRESEP